MSDSLVTLEIVALQAPLSMDFPDKNAGVGCSFLLQGIWIPSLRIEPMSPALADGFTTEPPHFKELCLILNVLS